MFTKLRSFAKQSFIYTLGGMLTRSLSFILVPIYTRLLTPDDYGILGTVSPIYSILNILLSLGLQSCLVRFYYDYQDQPNKLRDFLGTISVFLWGGGLAVTSFFMLAGPSLFGFIFSQTDFYPYIFLTICNAYLSNFQIVPLALFRAREQARWFSSVTVGDFLVRTLLIIYFVTIRREGAVGSLKGQVFASALTSIPMLWITIRNSSLSFSWPYLKTAFAFSLPLLPHLLGNWLLNVSDRIVLENWVSGDALGLYTLAYKFGSILGLISTSLNNAWVPIFYQELSTRKDNPLISVFITYQVLLITGVSLLLALLSQEAIEIMAGETYWSAYRLVPWVILGYLFRFFYFFPVNGLFYSKNTRWIPLATVLSGVINVGLNLWLVPQYGVTAAAFNTFMGFLTLFIIIYFIGNYIFPIHYEFDRLAQVVGLALGIFAIGWWLAPEMLWWRIIFKTALVLGVYPLLLYATGFFSKPECKRITQLWHRIKDPVI